MSTISRFRGNPIIAPSPGYLWEAAGTFNPAALDIDGVTHILYRAAAEGNISTFGYARSTDGFSIDFRSEKPVYFPRMPFEMGCGERTPGAPIGHGCEDPRLVMIDGRIYMTYTGYDGRIPRVAVSSIGADDFVARRWYAWSRPEAITPPDIADKDATILCERTQHGWLILHRAHESICGSYVESLDFTEERATRSFEIIAPRPGMWDDTKVGIAAPPVKTRDGWLLLYHGISRSKTYRVGAVLLDLDDPTAIRSRSAAPLLEPEESYEREGTTPNVVFPCGLVIRGNTGYIYYGAADYSIGVATFDLPEILRGLSS